MTDDHSVRVRSVQVYHGGFDASFVKDDGTLHRNALTLECSHEQSISFECTCGRRFYKAHTAAEHLLEESSDDV